MGKEYSNVGKPEGKRRRDRSRCRREDNIKIDFTEIRWQSVSWIYQAGDRKNWRAILNTAMKFFVA
jgi:hypothetical protein